MKYLISIAAVLSLTACGTTNNYLAEKTKTVEYYRIFDIKTTASKQGVIKAASDGRAAMSTTLKKPRPFPRVRLCLTRPVALPS